MYKRIFVTVFVLAGLILSGILGWWYFTLPPANFPINQDITLESNGLRALANVLENENLIRSSWQFLLIMRFNTNELPLQAGTYMFTRKLTVYELINQLQNGENSTKIYRLTLPEGQTVAQIALRAADLLPDFDYQHFLEIAINDEGLLFPDTYFLTEQTTPEQLHQLLKNTFIDLVRNNRADKIAEHKLSEYEIITLASIIEREANTRESKRMVAGILQNRLEINMPLQADASIEYVLDKPLSELTAADLQIESPYNTYLNLGLPPTPINNPGLVAIDAVLDPAETNYLFYITGRDGVFYYAKDFDEHRLNIQRYLR